MSPTNPHNAWHRLSAFVTMICIAKQYSVGMATSGIVETA
jgi:hypothetical protein